MPTRPLAAALALALVLAAAPGAFPPDSEPARPAEAAVTAPVAAAAAVPSIDLSPILGVSGNLRALIGLPATLAGDGRLSALLAGRKLDGPGVHALGLTAPDGEPLVAVAMTPFATGAKTGLPYRTGKWPAGSLAAKDARYAPPDGFIRVTPENAGTAVSKQFRLRDFLTHDQQNVWPKVLVIRPKLLDKLELIGEALDAKGLPSKLHVMSGFRTPQYNALGVRPGGRARNSRHMYGDASDVFVDADGDGRMDDLDHDGKITVKDARVLFAVAEGVEAAHPDLVGGLSAYPATSAHGPFVHVDTRGFKARW